ncbi:hypothetical protein ACKXF7_06875 [Faecalibacterium sp. 7]|uniref:hypothetical protein n=1 Tax=Faecalibacterium sp. 7 TaxID=3402017 RepID=UPI003C30AE7C
MKKMHFLRAGVDKRLDAYKTPHPAATGQVDVVGGFKVIAAVILAQFRAETDRRYRLKGISPLFRVLHQSIPKVGTLVFFASCLNIRKILQERRKSGRTATEKEKSPYWLQICNSKGRGETVY